MSKDLGRCTQGCGASTWLRLWSMIWWSSGLKEGRRRLNIFLSIQTTKTKKIARLPFLFTTRLNSGISFLCRLKLVMRDSYCLLTALSHSSVIKVRRCIWNVECARDEKRRVFLFITHTELLFFLASSTLVLIIGFLYQHVLYKELLILGTIIS